MAHIHEIEDEKGNLVDIDVFCSDFCNQKYTKDKYKGWYGLMEISFNTPCLNCGKIVIGVNEVFL